VVFGPYLTLPAITSFSGVGRLSGVDPFESTGVAKAARKIRPMPQNLTNESDTPNDADLPAAVKEPRLWSDNGWTARVIKNDDDDGWAVAMLKDGEPEPALVGPWTMGRDKKNPKPLDTAAFNTLVKTASEVLRRHEQQLHATLHKSVAVTVAGARWQVTLDIVPDEFEPHAWLSAHDDGGDQVARVRVSAGFRLQASSATAWVENEFRKPA
jgi:hypothetical protein